MGNTSKPSPSPEAPTSPMDLFACVQKLSAHVVDPTCPSQVHGYDVEADLARHYGFLDVALLALLGELPDEAARRALEVALCFAAPAPVSRAPAHAAALVRLCGARRSGVLGTGAMVLAEQAMALVEAQRAVLPWLADPGSPPREELLTEDPEELASLERLRLALARAGVQVPALSHPLRRDAALLAVLHRAGLRLPEQIECVLVMARLPCVVAEALHMKPRRFERYPVNVPRVRFMDPR